MVGFCGVDIRLIAGGITKVEMVRGFLQVYLLCRAVRCLVIYSIRALHFRCRERFLTGMLFPKVLSC